MKEWICTQCEYEEEFECKFESDIKPKNCPIDGDKVLWMKANS